METAPRRPARDWTSLGTGRVLGVPVRLSVSLLLLVVLVTVVYGEVATVDLELDRVGGYLVGLGFTGGLLGSVLLHELGHALTARRYGVGVRGITLEIIGGYTELDRDPPAPRAELLIALAGPGVSAALAAGAAGLGAVAPDGTAAHRLAWLLATVNLFVVVVNLLPGLPLDGGRALRAGVWAVTRDRHRGTEVAGWTGRTVAVAAGGTALVFFVRDQWGTGTVLMLLVAVIVWGGAGQAVRAARVGRRLSLVDLRRLARPVVAVPSGTSLAEAQHRAGVAGDHTAVGVADAAGRLVAVLDSTAVAAVPAARRPWMAVDLVARRLDALPALPVELAGEEVLSAVQAHPGRQYVVTAGEDVLGVLHLDDLARVLEARNGSPIPTKDMDS